MPTAPTVLEEEAKQASAATLAPPPIAAPKSAYKMHSLAAGYWGEMGQSAQPLRQVARAEAQATFLRGLLDIPTDHKERKPGDLLVSAAIHILIIAAIVIAPLLFTKEIDLRQFAITYLTAPPVPAAPPPPPPVAQAAKQPPKFAQVRPGVLTAPSVIPKQIAIVKEEAPPEIDEGGVVGGMPGGEGGILGGLLGGTGHVAQLAPPPPPAARQIYRVGGQVKPPMLIAKVPPQYPLIARKAHVEGIVVIDAVIDENGNVTQAHVVSGPALLFQSALAAVVQWKYQPTYLNGQPVPLELQVEVTFRLLPGGE
jgi:TonB family protein